MKKQENKLREDNYIDIDATKRNPAFVFISNLYVIGASLGIIYAISEYISYLGKI